jgi:fucose permease
MTQLPRAAVAGSLAAFALIGALQAIYGPLLPVFEARYGITRATAGSVLSAHFVGSLAGVLWAMWGLHRLQNRTYLVIGLATIAICGSLVAVAPAWWMVLAGAASGGFGVGVIDFGLNSLFALNFGARKGAMLNVLNALFGVGSVAGPLIVAALARHHASWIFAGVALLTAIIAPAVATVRGGAPTVRTIATKAPVRARLSATLWLFIAAYLFYMGVEAGIGGWEPTYLRAMGHSAAFAASSTSVFWLCLTAGRFLAVPVSMRVSAKRIVLVGAAVSVVALAAALRVPIAPYGFALAGLAIAPIFPSGLAWLAETNSDAGHAVAYLFVAVYFGGAVLPFGTGWIIQRTGATTTPAVLAAFALGCAASFGAIAVRARRPKS